jgi:hypothetical protein
LHFFIIILSILFHFPNFPNPKLMFQRVTKKMSAQSSFTKKTTDSSFFAQVMHALSTSLMLTKSSTKT